MSTGATNANMALTLDSCGLYCTFAVSDMRGEYARCSCALNANAVSRAKDSASFCGVRGFGEEGSRLERESVCACACVCACARVCARGERECMCVCLCVCAYVRVCACVCMCVCVHVGVRMGMRAGGLG